MGCQMKHVKLSGDMVAQVRKRRNKIWQKKLWYFFLRLELLQVQVICLCLSLRRLCGQFKKEKVKIGEQKEERAAS